MFGSSSISRQRRSLSCHSASRWKRRPSWKGHLQRSWRSKLCNTLSQSQTQQKSNHNEAVANGWQNSDAYTYINSHHQHHVWVQHLQLILLHMVNTFMDYESTMRNKLIPGDIESGTTAWCQTKRNMGHQAKKNNPNNPMPITHTCMLLLNLPYISASLSVVKYTIHGISWDGIPSCISRIHCSPLPKKGISKTNLAIQGSINSCWPEVKVPWPRVDTDFRFGGGWGSTAIPKSVGFLQKTVIIVLDQVFFLKGFRPWILQTFFTRAWG